MKWFVIIFREASSIKSLTQFFKETWAPDEFDSNLHITLVSRNSIQYQIRNKYIAIYLNFGNILEPLFISHRHIPVQLAKIHDAIIDYQYDLS